MKKIITLTLILIIAVTNIVCADMQAVKNDLTRYRIITDYNLETINRGEAAKIIATMLGQGDINRNDTLFTDVPEEYWASGYIDYANRAGIINGNGDGTFAPEEKVTNEQIVKMLVCALGYEPVVRGNYPVGYFITATEIGITKGLDLVGSEVAKRADVAVMVHNALDIPLMVQTDYGAYTQYAVMDGTGNYKYTTLRTKLDGGNEINEDNAVIKAEEDEVPRFNGPEYTGALLKIDDLKKDGSTITFKNSLNKNDKNTYIIDDTTYVYVSNNTLPITDIDNEKYVQCWYRIDETKDIHLLKIEIMKETPGGF